jgi:hypothetical protein
MQASSCRQGVPLSHRFKDVHYAAGFRELQSIADKLLEV